MRNTAHSLLRGSQVSGMVASVEAPCSECYLRRENNMASCRTLQGKRRNRDRLLGDQDDSQRVLIS